MNTFIEFCIHQHDIVCNQKYDKTLPYSYHLKLVATQVEKFNYLIEDKLIINEQNFKSKPIDLKTIVLYGAFGHDLIEDARLTYNDILEYPLDNTKATKILADIIYACTELRGKNREERKGEEYYKLLKENELALFVKLCDIIANVSYSLITNSSMYSKYQKEFIKLEKELYLEKYDILFKYLKNLLTIHNSI